MKKGEYLRREIAYGAFALRLPLLEEVEGDKISAGFRSAVVEITVPLAKEIAAPRNPLSETK